MPQVDRQTQIRQMNEAIAAAREAGTLVTPEAKPKPTFLRSSLRDVEFYRANQQAIEEAARDSRIVDDVLPARRLAWGGRN
jgi:hypothetical protein